MEDECLTYRTYSYLAGPVLSIDARENILFIARGGSFLICNNENPGERPIIIPGSPDGMITDLCVYSLSGGSFFVISVADNILTGALVTNMQHVTVRTVELGKRDSSSVHVLSVCIEPMSDHLLVHVLAEREKNLIVI